MTSSRALVFVLVGACSSPAVSNDAGDASSPDGLGTDVYALDVPSSDAPSDGIAVDSPRTDAPSGDADLTVSHPPADAHLCGSGAITQTSAQTECMAPSSILDFMPLPDGGSGMIARRCDAATVAGGRWEAWCSTTGVYLWARFEGIRSTANWVSCPGITVLDVGLCWGEEGAGGHGGGGTLSPTADPTYFFDDSAHPTSVVLARMLDASYVSGGSAHFFVTAYHDILCSGSTPMPGRDADSVIAGAAMTWPM